MRPTTVQSRPGTDNEERGAVLVEFAFVALFLFVLAAAAFDYGMAWRTGLAVNEAARTGARVGSAMGNGFDGDGSYVTDRFVLSGMKSALTSNGTLDAVEQVVIFRSDNDDGRMPSECRSPATIGGRPCNVITGDAFRLNWEENDHAFDSQGCFQSATVSNWCPAVRNSDQAAADYFGVWVQYRQDHFFGVTGSSVLVERQAVMRIEPTAAGG